MEKVDQNNQIDNAHSSDSFFLHLHNNPKYRVSTKLRRQIYGQLKENKLLLQLDIKEILQNFVKDIVRIELDDEKTDVFHCKCGWLLHDPITLPCGHTFCEYCVKKNLICLQCGLSPITAFNVSPMLVEVLSTCFETQYESDGYKIEASSSLSLNHFTEALSSINKAINLDGEDFISLNLRVEVYMSLQRYNVALKDAELSCKINDSCGRSHYIRGLCYAALKVYDDAIDAFQHSLELEPDNDVLLADILVSLSGLFASDVVTTNDDIKQKFIEMGNTDNTDNDSIKINDTQVSDRIDDSQEAGTLLVNDTNNIVFKANEGNPKLSAEMVSRALLKKVFECKLCYDLLFQPVTLKCGHVFCKYCLEKSLDYRAHCPMCRIELAEYRKQPTKPVTVIVEDILRIYLTEQFYERKNQYTEKMDRLSRVGIDESVAHPIFICSVAFPHVRCSLHIFEPRYRLMIRECIESGSRMFGMCSPMMDDKYSDIGTILYIDSFQVLDDGRYIIKTEARQRFICKEKSSLDSLDYTKVEYFQDDMIGADDMVNTDEFIESARSLYADLVNYISSLSSNEGDFIINALGPIPPFKEEELRFSPLDLPWAWWGLAALPLNFSARLALLRSKNTVERYRSLKRFLRFMTR